MTIAFEDLQKVIGRSGSLMWPPRLDSKTKQQAQEVQQPADTKASAICKADPQFENGSSSGLEIEQKQIDRSESPQSNHLEVNPIAPAKSLTSQPTLLDPKRPPYLQASPKYISYITSHSKCCHNRYPSQYDMPKPSLLVSQEALQTWKISLQISVRTVFFSFNSNGHAINFIPTALTVLVLGTLALMALVSIFRTTTWTALALTALDLIPQCLSTASAILATTAGCRLSTTAWLDLRLLCLLLATLSPSPRILGVLPVTS